MPDHALRYANEEAFQKALELLESLAEAEPLEYDLAYDPIRAQSITVLSQRAFDKMCPILKEHSIPFTESAVKSLNALPPEKQAKIRGQIWKRAG